MLNVQTEFLISLFVLLACALLAGEVALRLGQAALVGQLIVGVILGPTLLGPYIGLSTVSPQLSAIQLLATFFLLFMAGLELGPEQVYRMPFGTFLLGICVFAVPFTLTFAAASAVYPGIGTLTALFVAVTLSITALPIMAVMVSEFGLVGKPFGTLVMAAALINELAAVTVFAVLLQIYDAGSHVTWISFGTALGSTALFVIVVFGAYQVLKYLRQRRVLRGAPSPIVLSMRSREAGFAVLMILSLGAALFSQYLGLTFVIGAFYAGILVTPESAGADAYANVRSVLLVVMWGFFIPLFFAVTGLQVDLRLLVGLTVIAAFIALLLVAMFAKIGIGVGFARLVGWKRPDAWALGFMVNSRGAVEIAMAVILLGDGIISTFWFTVVVAVGLVCTVVAPIGAVAAWKSTAESRAELYDRVPGLSVHPANLSPAKPSGLLLSRDGGLQVSFSPPPGSGEAPRVIFLPNSAEGETPPTPPSNHNRPPSDRRPPRRRDDDP